MIKRLCGASNFGIISLTRIEISAVQSLGFSNPAIKENSHTYYLGKNLKRLACTVLAS